MITFTEAELMAWITPLIWPFIRILALLRPRGLRSRAHGERPHR